MTIRLLKDLDFAKKLSIAEPVTESALDTVKRYRGYMYTNAPTCTLVNNFIREAQNFGYDKGMSQILEAVESYIAENKISWKLATACESIEGSNSSYSYLAKLGIGKVEKLLEMKEADVISYIKAGALRGVKYIPEFREICKDVYRSQISESIQTINYEMTTPVSYIEESNAGDRKCKYMKVDGHTVALYEEHAEMSDYTSDMFERLNAHIAAMTFINEGLEYKAGEFKFRICEGEKKCTGKEDCDCKDCKKKRGEECKDDECKENKIELYRGENLMESFNNSADFLKYCDNMSRIMPGAQVANQFMSICGAISEVFESYDDVAVLDNVRMFKNSNGTKAAVIESKENVISIAQGNVKDSNFMVEALQNVQDYCGVDLKVIYENRINEDVKKGNPEQYAAIQEELQKSKDAQAAIRYKKIEQLSEQLKDDPAAIAVLNTLSKELRMLDEQGSEENK